MKAPTQKSGSLTLYALLLVAAVAAMVMLRQCSVKQLPPYQSHIAGGDTVNVAIELSPLGIYTVADTLGGEYYNLLREISRRHEVPMVFHPFTRLSDALEGLDKGQYRLVVSDIPQNAVLKQRYRFVNPVGIDRQVLVQRRDSAGSVPFASQLDLAGQHVTVPHNSPYITRLRNLSRELGDTIYVDEDPQYSSEQLIMLVAVGEIPNAVVTSSMAAALLPRYPQLDASLAISFNQFQGWVAAPSDSLLVDSLNRWLAH